MNISAVRRIPPTQNMLSPVRGKTARLEKEPSFLTFGDVDAAVAALRPAEAVQCLHPEALAQSAALFLKHFPGKAHYAVKVNPDPYVLTNLYEAGITHFDVASLGEVRQVHELYPNASMAFMHPVKGREAIRSAYFDYGVRTFVLDSYDELKKIQKETRNARDLTLIVRLAMPEGCAAVPLSGKFGATHELAVKLLQDAKKSAMKVGISFHVGSQTLEPSPYIHALNMTGDVMRESDVALDVLDVGGGFPIPGLGMPVPPLTVFFDAIREGLQALNLPETCDIWSEPGAGLSGLSATVVVRVELRKDDTLYLNDGNFGCLRDLCYEKRRNDVRMIRPSQKNGSAALKPFSFYGPACESMDFMPGPFMLPEDIREGDWIAVSGLGAYGQVFRTIYNGFYADNRVEIQKKPSAKLIPLPRKKPGAHTAKQSA